ncbi:class I SAM-dependent methyltransferase [Streptomyces sp. NPDC052236]|uniref:class I SAM-dependent methyltransferase n=1 Tax=Streptomyces sp. NPDC052236 TaxID=3365686 RepID=UPI0037D1695D
MSGDWRGGDYTAVGDAWAHAAHDVIALALADLGHPADTPVPRVLDVATGSGPAALAAARAGSGVVGVDLEPGLLRVAAERARRAGLAGRARFVVGDALALPFPAGTFDAVLSTFGVMFAPDPGRAAAELARVCRPGGVLAIASWTPDGVMGRIAPTVTEHLSHHPPDDSPLTVRPTLWGDPGHVRTWFAPLPVAVRTRVLYVRVAYPSVADAVRFFENKPGPLRAHRTALEAAGRWERARAALAALFQTHNQAADGSLLMDVPYLLTLGRVADPTDQADPGHQ